MELPTVLTLEDIEQGLAAATDWRRFWIWHGVKLSSFMAVCGLVPIGIDYLQDMPVSPWAFLLPVFLAAIVVQRQFVNRFISPAWLQSSRARGAKLQLACWFRLQTFPLLAGEQRPNNSFKPMPLRGTA